MQTAQSDVVKIDPKHYRVEFENELVRVLRVKYGPGEKSSMHTHPASVHVFLTDSRVRVTSPDGKSEDHDVKAGQPFYLGPFEHLPENLSTHPLELIQVELKH